MSVTGSSKCRYVVVCIVVLRPPKPLPGPKEDAAVSSRAYDLTVILERHRAPIMSAHPRKSRILYNPNKSKCQRPASLRSGRGAERHRKHSEQNSLHTLSPILLCAAT